MTRHGGMVWAGVFALAVAGCFPSIPLNPFVRPAPPQYPTPGSVVEVSARLQEALKEEGIALSEQRDGPALSLVGAAASGKMFTLLLQPDPVKGSKRTFVSILWEQGEDEQFRRMVLRALAPPEGS
jgi:hypothetical protein